MELDLVKKIKELFTSVAFDSYHVNDYLFNQNNPTAAMFYLSLANTNVAIIKSIYYCNYNELAKRKALEDFIKASSNIYANNTLGSLDKFYDSINCLYIFFNNVPDGLSSLIDLRNENYEDFFNALNNYVQDLSQQISKV